MNSFKSEVLFSDTFDIALLERESKGDHKAPLSESLLIVDRRLENVIPPEFLKHFPFIYYVDAGETLKDLSRLSEHMQSILKRWDVSISRQHRIIALGGGSVGDFAGFIASVLKRGVSFVQVPSTWLAAIDSAHGGKTALNVSSFKNQVGTFYPAERVLIFKELLQAQPPERAREGLGELFKMALIASPSFFSELAQFEGRSEELLWNFLDRAIAEKYKIVLQDPYETQGLRKVLNLGHTLGHVFESALHKSHGESVAQGLLFALEWSRHRGDLAEGICSDIVNAMEKRGLSSWLKGVPYEPLSKEQMSAAVLKDKKINSDASIDFIFIKKPGQVFVQKVALEEILAEARRQGWSRP